MEAHYKNEIIEDFNFTITINGKCNFDCSYCPLINKDIEISNKNLDEYYNFFIKNINELKKNIKNIVFIFF
jgi:sulfatase maturation enzyme AslB (radical SAM superfamily)